VGSGIGLLTETSSARHQLFGAPMILLRPGFEKASCPHAQATVIVPSICRAFWFIAKNSRSDSPWAECASSMYCRGRQGRVGAVQPQDAIHSPECLSPGSGGRRLAGRPYRGRHKAIPSPTFPKRDRSKAFAEWAVWQSARLGAAILVTRGIHAGFHQPADSCVMTREPSGRIIHGATITASPAFPNANGACAHPPPKPKHRKKTKGKEEKRRVVRLRAIVSLPCSCSH